MQTLAKFTTSTIVLLDIRILAAYLRTFHGECHRIYRCVLYILKYRVYTSIISHSFAVLRPMLFSNVRHQWLGCLTRSRRASTILRTRSGWLAGCHRSRHSPSQQQLQASRDTPQPRPHATPTTSARHATLAASQNT